MGYSDWTWRKAYQSLVEKAGTSSDWYKTPEKAKHVYVCITPQTLRDISMILFSPDTKLYRKDRPFVYFLDPKGKHKRESFDLRLIEALMPCLGDIVDEINPSQKKYWHHCEVLNWDHFAKVLGLTKKRNKKASKVKISPTQKLVRAAIEKLGIGDIEISKLYSQMESDARVGKYGFVDDWKDTVEDIIEKILESNDERNRKI